MLFIERVAVSRENGLRLVHGISFCQVIKRDAQPL